MCAKNGGFTGLSPLGRGFLRSRLCFDGFPRSPLVTSYALRWPCDAWCAHPGVVGVWFLWRAVGYSRCSRVVRVRSRRLSVCRGLWPLGSSAFTMVGWLSRSVPALSMSRGAATSNVIGCRQSCCSEVGLCRPTPVWVVPSFGRRSVQPGGACVSWWSLTNVEALGRGDLASWFARDRVA